MKRSTNVPENYYHSAWWKKFTKQILSPEDTECEFCGARRWKITRAGEKRINRRFSVHHKNYVHLWRETREDVMLLCSRCHDLLHDILRIKATTEAVTDVQDAVRRHFTYDKETNE